ncbi:hypothetical protein CDAR_482401 [Caerostris darwini]|uniref:Secreted protein n=1 Tax=Caerostris darwini TaxID=1538125 RepID=A0AAV4TIU6_9ARAC|nr:hypothetical protein CDAR_482401 [Caerostris darwini]
MRVDSFLMLSMCCESFRVGALTMNDCNQGRIWSTRHQMRRICINFQEDRFEREKSYLIQYDLNRSLLPLLTQRVHILSNFWLGSQRCRDRILIAQL